MSAQESSSLQSSAKESKAPSAKEKQLVQDKVKSTSRPEERSRSKSKSKEPKDQSIAAVLAQVQTESASQGKRLDSVLSQLEEQDKNFHSMVETMAMIQNQQVARKAEKKQLFQEQAGGSGTSSIVSSVPVTKRKAQRSRSQSLDLSFEEELDGDGQVSSDDKKSEVSDEQDEDRSLGHNPKRRFEVSEAQQDSWRSIRRMSDDWSEEDWKLLKASKIALAYTGHKSAKQFRALPMDTEAPALRFETAKTTEKVLKEQEQLLGAAGAAALQVVSFATEVSSAVKKLEKDVVAEKEDFASLQEAVVDMLQDTQHKMKEVSDHAERIAKLVATGFNKSILARRKQVTQSVPSEKKILVAKMSKLVPSEVGLFGGKIPVIAKAQRDIKEVSFFLW